MARRHTRKLKARRGGTTPRSSSGRRRTGRNLMGALEAAASPAHSPITRDLLAELEAAAEESPSSPEVEMDSADMEREMEQQIQASANFLKEEHANGVRICYTGQYQVPRDGRVKEKSDGIYTIKEFLKLGTDMIESDEQKYEQLMRMGLLPRPQYGDKFKTQQDLESLVASLDATYCTAQPRNPLTAHLPTCKECERLLKARVTGYDDEDFALRDQERIDRARYFARMDRKKDLKTKRASLMREARQAIPGARASLAAFDRERRQSSEARRTRRAAREARREARESRRTARRTSRRTSGN